MIRAIILLLVTSVCAAGQTIYQSDTLADLLTRNPVAGASYLVRGRNTAGDWGDPLLWKHVPKSVATTNLNDTFEWGNGRLILQEVGSPVGHTHNAGEVSVPNASSIFDSGQKYWQWPALGLKKLRTDYNEFAVYVPVDKHGFRWARYHFADRYNGNNQGMSRLVMVSESLLYKANATLPPTTNLYTGTQATAYVSLTTPDAATLSSGSWISPNTLGLYTNFWYGTNSGAFREYTISVTTNGQRIVWLAGGSGNSATDTTLTLSATSGGAALDSTNISYVNPIAIAALTRPLLVEAGRNLPIGTYYLRVTCGASSTPSVRTYDGGVYLFPPIQPSATGVLGTTEKSSQNGYDYSMTRFPWARDVVVATNATRIEWRHWKNSNAGHIGFEIFDMAGSPISADKWSISTNSEGIRYFDTYGANTSEPATVTLAEGLTTTNYYVHAFSLTTKNASSTGYRMFDYGVVGRNTGDVGVLGTDPWDDRDNSTNRWLGSPTTNQYPAGNIEMAVQVREVGQASFPASEAGYVSGIHGGEGPITSFSVFTNGVANGAYAGAAVGTTWIVGSVLVTNVYQVGVQGDTTNYWATIAHKIRVGRDGYTSDITRTTTRQVETGIDYMAMLPANASGSGVIDALENWSADGGETMVTDTYDSTTFVWPRNVSSMLVSGTDYAIHAAVLNLGDSMPVIPWNGNRTPFVQSRTFGDNKAYWPYRLDTRTTVPGESVRFLYHLRCIYEPGAVNALNGNREVTQYPSDIIDSSTVTWTRNGFNWQANVSQTPTLSAQDAALTVATNIATLVLTNSTTVSHTLTQLSTNSALLTSAVRAGSLSTNEIGAPFYNWVLSMASGGGTNNTYVNGGLVLDPNFEDNAELTFLATGSDINASIVPGSIGTNKFSASTYEWMLNTATNIQSKQGSLGSWRFLYLDSYQHVYGGSMGIWYASSNASGATRAVLFQARDEHGMNGSDLGYADLRLPASGAASIWTSYNDGSGSGLDADVIDGLSSASLLARANHTGTQGWSTLTSTPTTLSGYGITDAQPLDADLTEIASYSGASNLVTSANFTGHYHSSDRDRANHTGTQAWGTLTGTPTTLLGYGITDAQPLDDYLTDLSGATGTAGSLLYFNGTDLVELGVGSVGQVLISTNSPNRPFWGAVSGGSGTSVFVEGSSVANPNFAESSEIQWDVTSSTNVTPSLKSASIATNKIDPTFRTWIEDMAGGSYLPLTGGTLTDRLTISSTNKPTLVFMLPGVGSGLSNWVMTAATETNLFISPASNDLNSWSGIELRRDTGSPGELERVLINSPLHVEDEAYGSGWNANTEVPTKNAIYDKIESLSLGSSVWVEGANVTNPNFAESSEIAWAVTSSTNVTPSLKDGSISTNRFDSTAMAWIGSMGGGGSPLTIFDEFGNVKTNVTSFKVESADIIKTVQYQVSGSGTNIVINSTEAVAPLMIAGNSTADGQRYNLQAAEPLQFTVTTTNAVITNTLPYTLLITNASSGIFTNPPGGRVIRGFLWGGGGGGGSGRRGLTNTVRTAGAGGGSGGFTEFVIYGLTGGETFNWTNGTAGTGGPSITAASTAGTAGTAGGSTLFGVYRATGGGGGDGGSGGAAAGGSAGLGGVAGAAGGSSNGSGTGGASGTGTAATSGSYARFAGSGAAGGGLTVADAASSGGTGGTGDRSSASTAGGANGSGGGNGSAGGSAFSSTAIMSGGGGGGGASKSTGSAGTSGSGGVGGFPAGGGGGGAAGTDSTGVTGNNSGAGGDGGGGAILIIVE